MSFEEFSEFMHQRFLKEKAQKPGKVPAVIGSIFTTKYCPDAKLVECCRCGIPLYVVPWVYEEVKDCHVPWDQTKLPVFCQFCVPPEKFKGIMVQDIAAVLQHTGEK
jgi:hypothetical protein